MSAVQLIVLASDEPAQAARSGREDLSRIPAGNSRLPASLVSKLSVVSLHDATALSDTSRDKATACVDTHQDTRVGKSSTVLKRPLIQELDF